jgi:ubiquinone/menaquinone biosynthesis C-methylase UbiE
MKWNSKTYFENSQMQFQIGKMGIERLKPKKTEKILDVGCGIGNLTRIIADQCAPGQVVGIDSDTEMISFARNSLISNPLSNLKFIAMDALDIKFQQEFDAVFTNIVLHWIRPIQALLKAIYEALKPGGRIQFGILYDDAVVGSDPNMISPKSVEQRKKIVEIENQYLMNFIAKGYSSEILSMEEFQTYQSRVNPNLTYQVLNIQKWENYLATAGFCNITMEQQTFWQEFTDLEQYLEYRRSNIWLFFLGYFPEKYRDQIADKLAELIRTEWNALPDSKKEWPYREKWPVVFIHAKK